MQILGDFQTTVSKALTEIDPRWRDYPGLIVCGSHNPHNIEETINLIEIARETHLPFLGICWGHQIAAIEYARNVLGIKDATSEEYGEGTFIVKKRPEGLKVGLHDGETYWNNYEVTEEILQQWKKPKSFLTSQYHPEYNSSIGNSHPMLVSFIEMCKQYGKERRKNV